MKISCHVVEDLLPLYHDLVCTQESNALIEEHLKECQQCKKLLSKIEGELAPMTSAIDDTAPIKSIKKQWIMANKKSRIKGAVSAIFICVCLISAYYGLTQWKFIPVSTELLDVTEVSRLSDGRIVYHLNVKDNKDLSHIKFTYNDDGSFYMTPMRAVFEKPRIVDVGLYNNYDVVDFEFIKSNAEANNVDIDMTSCYFGTDEDSILIWKAGMELPKASDEIEKIYQSR